jgi:hypothetical protein
VLIDQDADSHIWRALALMLLVVIHEHSLIALAALKINSVSGVWWDENLLACFSQSKSVPVWVIICDEDCLHVRSPWLIRFDAHS